MKSGHKHERSPGQRRHGASRTSDADMSDLTLVEAGDRVDRIAFDPSVEFTDHVIEVGVYACPRCRTEIQFNMGTLRHFERTNGLALGLEWHQRCEAIRPTGAWEWAMDFRCTACGASVRIVYAHDGEYSMGAYKYRVLNIIEERGGDRAG
jgi:hypothetical protein